MNNHPLTPSLKKGGGRKPIDKQQPTECRQAVWDWIKAHAAQHGPNHAFAVADVDVMLDRSTVRDYLKSLHLAGYLGLYNDPAANLPKGTPNLYHLAEDTGVDAPRLRKDGTPVTQGIGRQQMWNAMRILKEFTATDLAFNASTDDHRVAEGEAKSYCQTLDKAGYLVLKGQGSGVKGQSEARYMLIPQMWTGPHPPQIQRTRQVYDPNLRKVVWSKVEGGAE